ncbi:unnamed protein product [Moneuplotes crassus]|uniref:Uncharacterized protein n=1 Tax=Euplotes crassus TaxID=5936 RepID=A0AAD1Y6A5_EUPCR|nr:unnamed protein product [Moneuplotes crassus]
MFVSKNLKEDLYLRQIEKVRQVLEKTDSDDSKELQTLLESIKNNFDLLKLKLPFADIEIEIREFFTLYDKINKWDADSQFDKLKKMIPNLASVFGRLLMTKFDLFTNNNVKSADQKKQKSCKILKFVEDILKQKYDEDPNLKEAYEKEAESNRICWDFESHEFEKKWEAKNLAKESQSKSIQGHEFVRQAEWLMTKDERYKTHGRSLQDCLFKAFAKFAAIEGEVSEADKQRIQDELRAELEAQNIDYEATISLYHDLEADFEDDSEEMKEENKEENCANLNNKVEFVEREVDLGFFDREFINGLDSTRGEEFKFCDQTMIYHEFSDSVEMRVNVTQFKELIGKSHAWKMPNEIRSLSIFMVKDENIRRQGGYIEEEENVDHPQVDEDDAGEGEGDKEPAKDQNDEDDISSVDSDDPDDVRKKTRIFLNKKDQEEGKKTLYILEEKKAIIAEQNQNAIAAAESHIDKIDIVPFLRVLPESLDSLSFSCLKYEDAVNANDVYNLGVFLRGVIMIGVKYLTIKEIDFGNPENVKMIRDVFKGNLDYSLLKYLSFLKCKNIWELDSDLLSDLNNLENLSFSHCGLHDEHLEHLKKLLEPFKHRMLNSLELNHNKIKNAGRDIIESWVKGDTKSLQIIKINHYNNSIKSKGRLGTIGLNTIHMNK